MSSDKEGRALLTNFATRYSGEVTLVSVEVADAIAEMLADNERLREALAIDDERLGEALTAYRASWGHPANEPAMRAALLAVGMQPDDPKEAPMPNTRH